MVDLSGLPEGLVGLLRDAVTGKNIHSIELAGVKAAGEGPAIKVYDLTLRNVMVAGYAEDGGHDTAVAFNYRSGTETISAQKPDGTTDAGQSVSFGGSLASVSQDTLAAFAHSHEGVSLTYLLRVDGVTGDSRLKGYEGWFTVDEYTFGELSQFARLGAGGGAVAGKAQLDPLMVDLSGLPEGLVELLRDAVTGKNIHSIELAGVKAAGEGPAIKVYDLTLRNVMVAGYAEDGGHDTAVAFNYRSGTETISAQKPDGTTDAGQSVSFGGSLASVSQDTLAAFAHSHEGVSLTYLLRVDGVTGDSRLKGYEGWFTVDEYTFGELSQFARLGAGGGAVAGKAQHDPLMVDLSGLPEGLVGLLRDAVTGKNIHSIELAGVKAAGEGPAIKVYDLTLRNVMLAGYAEDGGHDTAVAFNYRSGTETIREQKPDGTTDAGQTVSFGGSLASVSHDTLAAFAHSHEGVSLTYLLRVDGVTGDSTLKGYEGWFTVDEYTFGELSQLARLGAGGGAVAGKVQLDPLMVDLSGLPEGLVGLLRDAVTGKNINSIELAGVKAAGEGPAIKVYDLTLSNVRVAGYAEDGGHDTAVAFNYRSGTETIREQKPDGTTDAGQTVSFGASLASVSHDTLAAFAHSQEGVSLTYLLRVDGVTGDSTLKGYEGWFTVDEYTFGELSQLARLGAGGSAVAGKAQLDPLMVDLSGLPEGLVGLLRDAATGKNINSIELAGVKAAGEGPAVKVYDLTLSNVRVAGYAEDGGHDTAVAFNYRSGTETIREQKPDGTTDAGQTVSFGASLASVSHDTLAAFAHSQEGVSLTYLLRVDGVTGDSTLKGYEGWFTVDEYTFGELSQLARLGAGGSAVAGKAQLDPLMVDLSGLPEGLVGLLRDAATGKNINSI